MVATRWRWQRQKRRWGVPMLLVVYVGYVGLGAGVLQALERPAEERAAQHLLRQRWELLANHTCLRGPVLQQLIEGIVQAYKSGITLQGNTTSLGRWDFSGSFFFSISAITTIVFGVLYHQVQVVPDDGSGGSSDRAHWLWVSSLEPGLLLRAFQYKAVSAQLLGMFHLTVLAIRLYFIAAPAKMNSNGYLSHRPWISLLGHVLGDILISDSEGCYTPTSVALIFALDLNQVHRTQWYKTLITLILFIGEGYGNLSPSTAAGRLFCILFALFGIPLNLVLLNEIGQLMLLGVQRCGHRLEETFHLQKKASLLIKTSALVTGLLLFLLLPPLLLSDKEGWSYEEGFYYSFITLSTIGFGDYVIGMNPDRTYPRWYKNVISLWILFGMAWLTLVIKLCINFLESSSDFCQCNKSMVEKFMDNNINSTTGLHDVEICNDKDTKAKGPDETHTYTAPAEAL